MFRVFRCVLLALATNRRRHKSKQQSRSTADIKRTTTFAAITTIEIEAMRFSVTIFGTLFSQSFALNEDLSGSVRGVLNPEASSSNKRQLLTEGGCFDNGDCADNYFCLLPDGDCNSGQVEGECYEIRASRTRSFNRVCNSFILYS